MGMVLTPNSVERWFEFMDKLGEALFAGLAEDDRRSSLCEHDHRFATKIMSEMGGIDIPASLAFFRKHGGCCDCEVGFTFGDDDDELKVIERPVSKH
jgi:hypothetical protein